MMNAISKGQIDNITKGDIIGQKKFIESLFEMAALKSEKVKAFLSLKKFATEPVLLIG